MHIQTDRITKGALVSGGIAAILIGLFYKPSAQQAQIKPEVFPALASDHNVSRHSDLLGRKFRIRSGDPDAPMLSIGAVEIAKRKAGPIVLPAFNLLKIAEFELIFPIKETTNLSVFPQELLFLLPEEPGAAPAAGSPDKEPFLLTRLKEEILKGLGSAKKVSGVEIRPFRISVSIGETEIVILESEQADGQTGGSLRLKNCFCLDENKNRLSASRAVLQLNEPVRLQISGREILLRDMTAAHRP